MAKIHTKAPKQAKEDDIVVTTDADTDADMYTALKCLSDLNPNSCLLSENTLSLVEDYISTGCPALNAVISGDLYKGIPYGRITLFAGEPQSGKTFIAGKILAEAQKKGLYPIIFDSEYDKDKTLATNLGFDPKKVRYQPIGSIEQATIQMSKFLDIVVEKKLQGKFILLLDSLGNLASEKELQDAINDKTTSDMGLAAKAIKSFFRIMTYKCALSKTPLIITQHVYADPAAFHPSAIKKTRGGSGPQYMATVSVQMTLVKEEQDESNEKDIIVSEAKRYSGATIRFFTTKNRLIVPFLEVENYLSWKTGLDKYSGLKVLAENHGIISKDGHQYILYDGTKLGFYKNWRHDADLWENKIMPKLNLAINEAYRYHSDTKIQELTDEVNDVTP